jgi:hypothetical protein
MKKIILVIFTFFFFTQIVFSQSVKIIIGERVIETEIVANTSNEIFTKNGNFKIEDIDKITFKTYDKTNLPFYNDLLQKTKVEFEDGKMISLETIDADIEKYNSNLVKSPGDYFIEAGNVGIIGVLIPIAVATSAVFLEVPPIVIVAGGVAGIALQISAWSKVKKGGKSIKIENEIKDL